MQINAETLVKSQYQTCHCEGRSPEANLIDIPNANKRLLRLFVPRNDALFYLYFSCYSCISWAKELKYFAIRNPIDFHLIAHKQHQ